ncbi:type II secretion system protein [Nautilia sp.]
MRKSLTLIELIFTIVIIALVFTVIPKIIYISNKSLEFSKKEDALFNMMAKMADISLKEYDEKNTEYDDILLTGNSNVLECNASSGYRVGGFAGGRNCKNAVLESDIGSDTEEPPFDDVDDYNGTEENTTRYGRTLYTLKISVGYTGEWGENDYNHTAGVLNYTFNSFSGSGKTDIKRIEINICQNDNNISSVKYYSSNIGHAKIESVQW